MQILILAHAYDYLAHQVAGVLASRFTDPVVNLLLEEELACALHWSHEIDSEKLCTEIKTSTGKSWHTGDTGVVLNRLQNCTVPLFSHADEYNRNYATMEMFALWLSWLKAFDCPVVNPVHAVGFGNTDRSPVEWYVLANRASLPTRDYVFTTDPLRMMRSAIHDVACAECALPAWIGSEMQLQLMTREPTLLLEPLATQDMKTVWIIGDRVIGSVDERLQDGMRQLSKLSQCDLLEVTLGKSIHQGEWKVATVSSFPQNMDEYATGVLADYLYQTASS